MDRDEFNFLMSIARKGLLAGTGMAICAILCILLGHPSTKGYIFLGLWLALMVFGVASAFRALSIGRRMEASGQIIDRRDGN